MTGDGYRLLRRGEPLSGLSGFALIHLFLSVRSDQRLVEDGMLPLRVDGEAEQHVRCRGEQSRRGDGRDAGCKLDIADKFGTVMRRRHFLDSLPLVGVV